MVSLNWDVQLYFLLNGVHRKRWPVPRPFLQLLVLFPLSQLGGLGNSSIPLGSLVIRGVVSWLLCLSSLRCPAPSLENTNDASQLHRVANLSHSDCEYVIDVCSYCALLIMYYEAARHYCLCIWVYSSTLLMSLWKCSSHYLCKWTEPHCAFRSYFFTKW